LQLPVKISRNFEMIQFKYAIILCLIVYPYENELVAQWQPTTGIEHYTTTALATQSGNLFVTAYTRGVYWSTDHGTSWIQRSTGLADSALTALTSDGTNLYVGTETKGVFRTTDQGAHWTSANTGISYTRILSLCSYHGIIFAGAYGSGLFRSTNQGSSWQFVNTGIPYSDYRSLASNDSGIFAGTYPGDVIRSTDNGTTWKSLHLAASGWVTSILLSGSTILASTDGSRPHVFRSKDMGTTWTISDSGMSAPGVYAFAQTQHTLFAGTYWGFYVSSDTGKSWKEQSTGLWDLTIYALALDTAYIIAGGYDKGVWRRPISEIVTSAPREEQHIPKRFQLEQNYPNPFNPSTTISFSLPFRSSISLKVFDVLGREIATLVSVDLPQGQYLYRWEPMNIPSGVYFYRLEAGGDTESKKLLLVR
jgi:ligand-binding sensor domain-containing protein